MHNNTEILAPAGDEQMLYAAVMSGANAVYLGLSQHNARRNAGNFNAQTLINAVTYCHARDVKVYVTLNTLVFENELCDIANLVQGIANAGADAVIVQDLAVAALVKQMAPTIKIHGSTQMSVHSLQGARALKALGFDRVILSRELSLFEIEHISQNSGIETEVFVHGALCMCVSGQCYMSAFFGGRSANRGMCAGPCRLPFSASMQNNMGEEKTNNSQNVQDFHLSLKDMSHLEHLNQIFKSGVCSVKIEGRMRTAEYAASCVNACVSVRQGLNYDAKLLENVFSRSGFTNAYLKGNLNGEMFGVRTKQQAQIAKKAQNQTREFYRRELQRVPIKMQIEITNDGAKLTICDLSGNKVEQILKAPVQKAQKNQKQAIEKALSKLGGTIFLLENGVQIIGEDYFLPAAQLNEMRRQALELLLQKRSVQKPHECILTPSEAIEKLINAQNKAQTPLLRQNKNGDISLYLYFTNISQYSKELLNEEIHGFIVPITQYNKVPLEIMSKTYFSLPEFCAQKGEEYKISELIKQIQSEHKGKFAGFYAQNIAHISMFEGSEIFLGFRLNVTNSISAASYAKMGVSMINLSIEASLRQMQKIAPPPYETEKLNKTNKAIKTVCTIYGHMPLMLTRACPLHNITNCKDCEGSGILTDRKNMQLYVSCTAKGAAGTRTIYNAVPLYMGDRLCEVPTNAALCYFTLESEDEVLKIVQDIKKGAKQSIKYTRGLYEKGVL